MNDTARRFIESELAHRETYLKVIGDSIEEKRRELAELEGRAAEHLSVIDDLRESLGVVVYSPSLI